jgi:hypothetical protein
MCLVRKRPFIIDTGSSVSLIQPGVSDSKVKATDVSPIGVTGDELRIQGEKEVFCINDRNFHHRFSVCSLPTEAHSILGTDYFTNANARLDLESLLELKPYPRHDRGISEKQSRAVNRDQVAVTIFHAQESQTNHRTNFQNWK